MPTIKIHNIATDEIIEREMTAEEIAQLKKDELELALVKNAKLEAEQKRISLLEKLGLTTEEAKVLLG